MSVMDGSRNLYPCAPNIPTPEEFYATCPAANMDPVMETVPDFLPVRTSEKDAEGKEERSMLQSPSSGQSLEETAENQTGRVRPEKIKEAQDGSEQAVDEVEAGRNDCRNGEYEKAVSWFKKGVSTGNMEAVYELAMCYMEGKGVPKEERTALNLFLNYAENGTDAWTKALAKFRIGQIYENGYGGKAGRKEAEKWFRESASEGNPYAAKKFRKGRYVKS